MSSESSLEIWGVSCCLSRDSGLSLLSANHGNVKIFKGKKTQTYLHFAWYHTFTEVSSSHSCCHFLFCKSKLNQQTRLLATHILKMPSTDKIRNCSAMAEAHLWLKSAAPTPCSFLSCCMDSEKSCPSCHWCTSDWNTSIHCKIVMYGRYHLHPGSIDSWITESLRLGKTCKIPEASINLIWPSSSLNHTQTLWTLPRTVTPPLPWTACFNAWPPFP